MILPLNRKRQRNLGFIDLTKEDDDNGRTIVDPQLVFESEWDEFSNRESDDDASKWDELLNNVDSLGGKKLSRQSRRSRRKSKKKLSVKRSRSRKQVSRKITRKIKK